MRAFRILPFLALSSAIFGAAPARAGQTWALGITGGQQEPLESFFSSGVEQFSDAATSLGIPESRFQNLFGHDRYQYFQKRDPKTLAAREKARDRFMRSNPVNCDLAQEYLGLLIEPIPSSYYGNKAFSNLFSKQNLDLLKSKIAKLDSNSGAYEAEQSSDQGHLSEADADNGAEMRRRETEESLFDTAASSVIDQSMNKHLRTWLKDTLSGKDPVRVHPTESDTLDPRITGEATSPGIDAAISKLASNVAPGDHVFLSFTDHGLEDDHKWLVGLADDSFLSNQDVQKMLDVLEKKQVTVHLYVDACFSGGFAPLTHASAPDHPGSCVIATADRDLPGYETGIEDAFFPSLAQNHNSLSAFACGLAKDQLNRPNTSLDLIVHDWEKSARKPPVKPGICDINGLLGTEPLRNQIEALSNTVTNPLRKELIHAYETYFIAPFTSCLKSVKDADPNKAFLEKYRSCAGKPTGKIASNGVAARYLDMETATQSIEAGPHNDRYRSEMIEHHLRFLGQAEPAALEQYKNAFCCLAYDLKTGKYPDICGPGK